MQTDTKTTNLEVTANLIRRLDSILQCISYSAGFTITFDRLSGQSYQELGQAIKDRQNGKDKILIYSVGSIPAHAILVDENGNIIADRLAEKRKSMTDDKVYANYQGFEFSLLQTIKVDDLKSKKFRVI